MLDAGAAIVDVGGESTRPGSDGVERRRGARARSSRCSPTRRRARLGRHVEGRRSRAARSSSASSWSTTSPRCAATRSSRASSPTRVLSLPDAHARRAAHDAGRPALRRRRLGGEALPRGAARVRGRRGSARSSSASTRASASARRSRTTSSSCAGSTSCRDRPAAARRLLAQELARKLTGRPTTGTAAASVGAAVAAFERGATILRVHDVRDARRGARRRGGGARMKVELARARACSASTACYGRSARSARRSSSTSSSRSGSAARPTGIEDAVDYREVAHVDARALGRAAVQPARGARDCGRRRARTSASARSACVVRVRKRPRRPTAGRVQSAVDGRARRDASRTSGSARTSATAKRRSAQRSPS